MRRTGTIETSNRYWFDCASGHAYGYFPCLPAALACGIPWNYAISARRELASARVSRLASVVHITLAPQAQQASRLQAKWRALCRPASTTTSPAAPRSARLDIDIAAMPMGLETFVMEGGGQISGGQRRRAMIARALVNRPRLIFLDQAVVS
jgi:ABC-type glutathione transport system ATPase component